MSQQSVHVVSNTDPVRFFDLQALATFDDERPAIQVIAENRNARLLLLAFKAGQQLKEHRTSSQTFVQVLRGHVVFTAQGQSFQLTAGTALHVAAATPHSVTASVESVILLTMMADTVSPRGDSREASSV